MRVLLVSPNREHVPDPVFPIGLAYIASAVMKHGHEVRTADLCFCNDIDRCIKETISSFSPEVIGISLRNIDDVSYPKKHSYLHEYVEAVDTVRKYSDAPVVLGGSGFTIMPELFMKHLKADFGITGEGEESFPELLRKLSAGGRAAQSMPAVCSSPGRIQAVDDIVPDRTLFDSNAYYSLGGMLNIQTKRGCPFNCIYCTYPNIEGKKVRMRSPASVADELEQLTSMTGIVHFFIVDSIFNHPVEHAEAVCTEIIHRGLQIKWSCYANPACMTERLAGLMAKAGCTGVEFGTDSLVDDILNSLGKNFTFTDVKKASSYCREHGIKFCHFIFAGSPGDNEETVKNTMERLEEINPDAAVIMAGIRIFPGTRLAEMARHDLGISDIGLEPVFYISKNTPDTNSIAETVSGKRHWVMPGYEINLYPKLQKKLRQKGIKGALWEELSKRT